MLLRVLIVKRICLTWSFNCKTNLLDLDLLALDLTEPWISLNLGTNFNCILTFRCSFFCPAFLYCSQIKRMSSRQNNNYRSRAQFVPSRRDGASSRDSGYHRGSGNPYTNQQPSGPTCYNCGVHGHYANFCPKAQILKDAKKSKKRRHKDVESSSDSSSSSSDSSSDEDSKRKKKRKFTNPATLKKFERKNPGKIQELIKKDKIEKKDKRAREQVTRLSRIFSEQLGVPINSGPSFVTPVSGQMPPIPEGATAKQSAAQPEVQQSGTSKVEVKEVMLSTLQETLPQFFNEWTEQRKLVSSDTKRSKRKNRTPASHLSDSSSDSAVAESGVDYSEQLNRLERQISELTNVSASVSPVARSDGSGPNDFRSPVMTSPLLSQPDSQYAWDALTPLQRQWHWDQVHRINHSPPTQLQGLQPNWQGGMRGIHPGSPQLFTAEQWQRQVSPVGHHMAHRVSALENEQQAPVLNQGRPMSMMGSPQLFTAEQWQSQVSSGGLHVTRQVSPTGQEQRVPVPNPERPMSMMGSPQLFTAEHWQSQVSPVGHHVARQVSPTGQEQRVPVPNSERPEEKPPVGYPEGNFARSGERPGAHPLFEVKEAVTSPSQPTTQDTWNGAHAKQLEVLQGKLVTPIPLVTRMELHNKWLDLQALREKHKHNLDNARLQLESRFPPVRPKPVQHLQKRGDVPPTHVSTHSEENKDDIVEAEEKTGLPDIPRTALPQRTTGRGRSRSQSRIQFTPTEVATPPRNSTSIINVVSPDKQQPELSTSAKRAAYVDTLRLPTRLRVRGKVWDRVKMQEECERLSISFDCGQLKALAKKLSLHIQ